MAKGGGGTRSKAADSIQNIGERIYSSLSDYEKSVYRSFTINSLPLNEFLSGDREVARFYGKDTINGEKLSKEESIRYQKTLENIINRSTIPQKMEVVHYSGSDLFKGRSEIKTDRFLSTTLKQDDANLFAKKYKYLIEVPKGTKGLYMTAGFHSDEQECLFTKGKRLKKVQTELVDGTYVVKVKMWK